MNVKTESPDVLDQAMADLAKPIKRAPSKPNMFKYLNAKVLSKPERIALITKYNEYFSPKVSLQTTCGSSLSMFQRMLKKHLKIK